MSFILDALKRSQRERRVRRAHDFGALYESDPEPKRGKGLWVALIAAVAVNLALLLWLFLWTERAPRETPSASPAASTPAPNRAREASPELPPQASAPARPLRNDDAVRPEARKKEAVPLRQEEPLTARQVPVPARPLSQEALVPSSGPESRALEPGERHVRPITTQEKAGDGGSSLPSAGPAFKHAESTEPPAPFPAGADASRDESPSERSRSLPGAGDGGGLPRQERVPLVKELPPGTGEKLKGLRINVHAYYDDPAQRFVFINMRRYAAGDRVGRDGPTVESITPDGVVLNYGGGRALLQTDN